MPTSWTEVSDGSTTYTDGAPFTLWDVSRWDEALWDGAAVPAGWTETTDGTTIWS